MGRAILNGPPPTSKDHGERWCPLCLARAKQMQWEANRAKIEAAQKLPDGELVHIPWQDEWGRAMRPALYLAVPGDAPQLGVIEVCWDDVAGMKPASALLNGGATPPPGLLRGRG